MKTKLLYLFFITFSSTFVFGQYAKDELLIYTDGGRIITQKSEPKPYYRNQMDEYIRIKLHILSEVNPLNPYNHKKGKIIIGQPFKKDSLEILFHCNDKFDSENCINHIKDQLLNSKSQVVTLKKSKFVKNYVYKNSFWADDDKGELNAFIKLVEIKKYAEIYQLKTDQEQYNAKIKYLIEEYTEGFKNDNLIVFEPENNFVNYYRSKKIIPQNSYSVVFSKAEKEILYKRLMEKREYDDTSIKGMQHRFELLLPEYNQQKYDYFFNCLDTASFRETINTSLIDWDEVILNMETLESYLPENKKDIAYEMRVEISDIIANIRSEQEFCENQDKLIANKIFPIIEKHKNFIKLYSIRK